MLGQAILEVRLACWAAILVDNAVAQVLYNVVDHDRRSDVLWVVEHFVCSRAGELFNAEVSRGSVSRLLEVRQRSLFDLAAFVNFFG